MLSAKEYENGIAYLVLISLALGEDYQTEDSNTQNNALR